jgi:hypothetical protein
MRLLLLVGLVASLVLLASGHPLDHDEDEVEAVELDMDVEDDADLKRLLQGLFMGKQGHL